MSVDDRCITQCKLKSVVPVYFLA